MDRLIFHVDVNSAFLSWEATRRVKEGGEDLRLIPACIGGDPERRTSVVLAKSIPAKAFGIRTGEPISMALRKCPDLVIAPSDFRLYEECSEAFIGICRQYAPVVEKFSIDECFLDMTGTGHMYPDPIATAYELKNTIRDTLGFTVNIGVGSNKLLAKTAGDFEKPDKVHSLFSHELADKFWPLPVGDLISVGATTAKKLERLDIRTIGELADYPLAALQAVIGNKMGQQLHEYANGIDHSPVLAQAPEAKGYSVSTTLEENVTTTEQANHILLALADSVTARMRSDGAKAYCVAVTMRSIDFKNRSHQLTLEAATDITTEVYDHAKALFAELWDGKTPLRLIGLSLSEVTRDSGEQMSLFEDERKDRARKIDRAMDAIRNKYGSATIMRGSVKEDAPNVGKKYKAHLDRMREEE